MMEVELYNGDLWTTPKHDNRVVVRAPDGRRIVVHENNGALAISSWDGDLVLRPLNRSQVEIVKKGVD